MKQSKQEWFYSAYAAIKGEWHIEDLILLIEDNSSVALLSVWVVTVFLLIVVVALAIKILRMHKRYRTLLLGEDGLNLEEALHRYESSIGELQGRQKKLLESTEYLKHLVDNVIMGVGLVRYNAFKETGSDLSFSLALLSSLDRGVVVTSIFGREETRVYAKDVNQGSSPYYLSEEELEAIKQARTMIDGLKNR